MAPGGADSQRTAERLDQILLKKGRISEEQLRTALDNQKLSGGRLGEHLLQSGAIDERGLVDALAEHFGVPGVVLEDVQPPQEAIGALSPKLVRRFRAAPFDLDSKRKTLSVAFTDPLDNSSLEGLTDAVHPLKLKVYVGAAFAIHSFIERHFESDSTELTTQYGRFTLDGAHRILVIAKNPEAGHALTAILGDYGHLCVSVVNKRDAFDRLTRAGFDIVLRQAGHELTIDTLKDALANRKNQPRIITVDRIDRLLLERPVGQDILTRAFRETVGMLVSILETGTPRRMGRSWWMGNLAAEVAKRIGLSPESTEELRLTTLLADIALWGDTALPKGSMALDRAAELLRPLAPACDASGILRALRELQQSHEKKQGVVSKNDRRRIEARILRTVRQAAERYEPLGGNGAETAADLIEWLQDNQGSDPEILTQTIHAIRELDLRGRLRALAPEILLGSATDGNGTRYALTAVLRATGKRLLQANTLQECLAALDRRAPDIFVALLDGNVKKDSAFVAGLSSKLAATGTPLMVIVPEGSSDLSASPHDIPVRTVSADAGIPAIVTDIDALMTGSDGLAGTMSQQHAHDGERGVTGALRDLPLVDLIQVLSAGRKTVRIELSRGDRLGVIEMENGHVVHAAANDREGGDAFYALLGWEEGQFAVRVTEEADERTIAVPIDALLLEGCRLIDEHRRGNAAETIESSVES